MTRSPTPSPAKPRIVICGLARDCKKNLRRNWNALQEILNHTSSCQWVIVENDSVDGTKEWLLEKAAQNPSLHVIGESIGEASIPTKSSGEVRPWFSLSRIGKMAFFRNQYLEFVEKRIGFDQIDALLLVDLDVRELPISRICHWLDHFDDNSVITAFGIYWRTFTRKGFYDAYAYTDLDDSGPLDERRVFHRRNDLYLKYCQAKSPTPVLSNFSGCALYPARLLHGLRYQALPNDDKHVESLCEHTSLHRGIQERGGSVVIDPGMRVHYSTAFLDWKRYLADLIKINFPRKK